MSALPYRYDLLFDIKTEEQLHNEVDFLAHRLSGSMKLRREDGAPIDDYVIGILNVRDTKKEAQP